jgi:hypothetical protein
MGARITIDTGNAKRPPLFVFDPDSPPGVAVVELPDMLPGDGDVSRPLVGIHPDPDERAEWHKAIPAAGWSRVFYAPGKGLPSLAHPVPADLIKRKKIVHASAKDAGTADQIWREFDTIPDGVHYKRTFWHERQGDDVDPAMCLAQDKLLRQVADDHPRRAQIELVGVHTLFASRFKRGIDWRRYVSTDMDTMGWDCYWGEDMPYEAPESLLGLPLAAASEFGFPRWEITELGASQRKPNRVGWYGEVIDAAAKYGCTAVGIWLTRKTVGSLVLDYRPQTLAETRQLADLVASRNGA